MIRRTTWIILGVFIVLLGLAWYLQRNKPAAAVQTTPTPERQYLFDIQESNIKKLEIANNQGQRVVLGRDASGVWSLQDPKVDATDVAQAEVGGYPAGYFERGEYDGSYTAARSVRLERAHRCDNFDYEQRPAPNRLYRQNNPDPEWVLCPIGERRPGYGGQHG